MSAVIVLGAAEKEQVRKTLLALATVVAPCKACGRQLYFCTSKTGAKVPLTDDGVSHFKDCPEPARFSSKGGRRDG